MIATAHIMPGLHPGLSREAYDAIDAVNQSTLKVLATETPADYEYALANPKEQTEEMLLGTLAHMAVYEPATFLRDVVVSPKFDRRTKVGKEDAAAFEAAAVGKHVLDEADHALLLAIQEAVMAHASASRLMNVPGHREATVVWKDAETGILCKGRIDHLAGNQAAVIDLKTTRDGRPELFASEVYKRGYHFQGAFYADGIAATVGCEPPAFCLIVADKTRVARYGARGVCVLQLEPAAMELGRIEYRRALATVAECRKAGVWPGLPEKITDVGVPSWALRKENIESTEEAFS